MSFKLKIEQIAFSPRQSARAMRLLHDLGCDEWVYDVVCADGRVRGHDAANEAGLSFTYMPPPERVELEMLEYVQGDNWIRYRPKPVISHIGMHCTEAELAEVKRIMYGHNVEIAQEVWTTKHTNPFLIETGRKYHYCIFGTRDILGTDLKFIVRIENESA